MEKKNLYILIIILGIVGVGGGLGIYYLIQGLNIPPAPEQDIFAIYGPGTTGNYTMTMTELQSTKYVQVTNQEFITKNYVGEIVSNGNYSGVSLRSILEEESLLGLFAENFTGIGLDGFNPGVMYGMLNISDVMNNDYALCIIAYGGPDFNSEDDAPLKLMINQSIIDISIRAQRYCVKQLASIYIAEKDILTIYGSGVISTFGMTMTELQSTKYIQVTNQEFYTRNFEGVVVSSGFYSGVSLRSVLEEESLLKQYVENYTGIGSDDYNPGAIWGMLNISDVMNNDYALCIIAYGGTDFDPIDDAPLKLMINQSIVLPTIRASRYCVKSLASIFIAEKEILEIYGTGVIGSYGMTLTELQSSDYVQIINQEFFTLNYLSEIVSNGNYSGVSLRSILEEEGLLAPGAENYTGIGLDDYNPGDIWGMLNISDVMNNDYDQCIIAYNGPDFDPLGDVPLKLMINQSIVLPSIRASRYCVRNLASILIE